MFRMRKAKQVQAEAGISSNHEEPRVHYLPLPLKKKIGVRYCSKDDTEIMRLPCGEVYYTSEYVGYDSGDEDGFGMEDEYDYHFFDGEKRYLGTLSAWSRRDFSLNRDRIIWFLNQELERKNS